MVGKHPAPFWRRFLLALDAELQEPHVIVVIGGAAIALQYTDKHFTDDLDAIARRDDALWAAVERAREKVRAVEGLEPPEPLVQVTGVYDAPYNFEDRLQRLGIHGLRYLIVYVPERYDLALMKTARGQDRDRAALEKMHCAEPFELEVLVQRYEEMLSGGYIGHPARLRANFLALVSTLFGEKIADELEQHLK